MLLDVFIRRIPIAGAVLAAVVAVAAPAGAQSVGITVNGNPVNVYPAPITQAGRVFVPLRGVFENLGASVVYDSGEINASGDGHNISLHIGSTQAEVDGQPQTIDVAPFIIGASTYVPLRFVSQALGATVDYDGTNRIVAITDNYQSQAQAPAQNEPYGYAYDEYTNYANQPPPPLPYYEQPPVPAPGYQWQPGYWAWGPGGYYWVPGTWVAPPQPNLYWTPPFWAVIGGIFGFHQGYWGNQVGYYGGVNYGNGYNGNGYGGGRWENGLFRYNSAATNVSNVTNETIIKNVYVDKTVVVNNEGSSTPSYVGKGGVESKPTAKEITFDKAPHVPPTQEQVVHEQTAAQDHNLLATANGGKPPVLVAPKPLTPDNKPEGFTPITEDDKAAAKPLVAPKPTLAPVEHIAPVEHTAPVEKPAPVEKAAPPTFHEPVPAVKTPAPIAPEHTMAPMHMMATPRPYVAPRPVITPHAMVAPRPVITPHVMVAPHPVVTPHAMVVHPPPHPPVQKAPPPKPKETDKDQDHDH